MIEVEHLCKQYGATRAVDDVSFSVGRGEILGLLGANGAGKTTIMRILTCFCPPTSGAARVAGFDVVTSSMDARRRIGYMPESVPLYRDMKVRPFLRFAAQIKGLSSARRDQAVEEAIGKAGLGRVAQRIVGNLSRGYRQRVGLAQAIVANPEILILDEPTAGLDPAQVVGFRELIRAMAGKTTIILSTHILPEVAVTCQKVVILHRGKVVAWGEPQHLHTKLKVSGRVAVTVGGASAEEIRRALLAARGVKAVLETRPRGSASTFVLRAPADAAPEIARAVVSKGWSLLDLREAGDTLEDVFMQAISGKAQDTP